MDLADLVGSVVAAGVVDLLVDKMNLEAHFVDAASVVAAVGGG